jgi:hypothetical protein
MAQINHTNRQGIEHHEVHIQLYKQYDPWRFDLTLDLDRFNFPGNSKIIVEASHTILTERFDFGTVDAPYPHGETDLMFLTGRPSVTFRIKIVASDGSGLLLAEADGVKVSGSTGSDDRQKIILEYQESDDRPLPWWLDFNSDIPTVIVNASIADSGDLAKSNLFRGLNMATIVETVLTQLCFVSEFEDYDAGDLISSGSWESLWIRFIRQYNPAPFDPLEESLAQDKTAWINDSVDMFVRAFRPLNKLNATNWR